MKSILFIILRTISILWFGHSFGVDSSELLPKVASEGGIDSLYVGRFIKANCSLEEHYNYYLADTTGKYSECIPGSTKYVKLPKTVREAVAERKWDFVIFQNSLENEGRYETAQPYLNDLVALVRNVQKEKFGGEPTIGWNMFWPISKLHENGSNKQSTYRMSFYGNSSERMFAAYIYATKKLVKDTGIKLVIPTGTAVMNARGTSLNDIEAKELTRDGYHLSYDLGRYLAACTVYETILAPISGKTVLGNAYRVTRKGKTMTDFTATILQRCADKAVRSPYKVNSISEKL